MLIRLFAAFLRALVALAPTAAWARWAPRVALWKLADSDTTIYLFGTIHALPEDMDWNTGQIRKAFDRADTLVVEVAETTDPQNALKPMLELGMAAPGTVPPLAERIPEPARPALKATLARPPVERKSVVSGNEGSGRLSPGGSR